MISGLHIAVPLPLAHFAVLSVLMCSTGLVDCGLVDAALLVRRQQRRLRPMTLYLVLRLARRSHPLTVFRAWLGIIILVESRELLIQGLRAFVWRFIVGGVRPLRHSEAVGIISAVIMHRDVLSLRLWIPLHVAPVYADLLLWLVTCAAALFVYRCLDRLCIRRYG